MTDSSIEGYIRIVGQHHAIHHAGDILGVTRNAALSNPEVVHLDQAHVMVERGDAEWVRGGGAVTTTETDQDRERRHADEVLKLVAQQETQHQQLMNRHTGEHESPQVMAMRHLGERRKLMHAHKRQQTHIVASEITNPAKMLQSLGQQQITANDELKAQAKRQADEPEAMRVRQLGEHQLMLRTHVTELAALLERQAAENKAASASKDPK